MNATVTVSSPLGRSAVSAYDPVTLLTERSHVPGYFDTVYEYYPELDAGQQPHPDYGKLKFVKVVDQGNADALQYAAFYTYYQAPSLSAGLLHTAGIDLNGDEDYLDAGEQFVEYEYDNLGRVTKITGPDTNFVEFWYDANGNMTVLTTPTSVDHTFTVNAVDSPETYVTPQSGFYKYEYDLDRRPKKVIFPSAQDAPTGAPAPDNRIIQNFYHAAGLANAGLLDYISTPEGDIEFFYGSNPSNCGDQLDLITKLDGVSLATESVSLVYDGPVVTSVTLAGTVDETISFDYRNGDLALQSVTYAGNQFDFGYDADGLLTSAEGWTISRTDPVTSQPNATGLAEFISDGTLTITPEYLAPGASLMDGAVYGVDYSFGSTSVVSWDVTRRVAGSTVVISVERTVVALLCRDLLAQVTGMI